MSPISKISSQIVNVSRLSSAAGVSRVKAPALASLQVIPAPVTIYEKQTESSQEDQAPTSEVLHQSLALTKLPQKRWETEHESKIRVSNVSILHKL